MEIYQGLSDKKWRRCITVMMPLRHWYAVESCKLNKERIAAASLRS